MYSSEGEGGRSINGMGEVVRSKSGSKAGRIMPASLRVGERCPWGTGREAAATAMATYSCVGGSYLSLAAVLNMSGRVRDGAARVL